MPTALLFYSFPSIFKIGDDYGHRISQKLMTAMCGPYQVFKINYQVCLPHFYAAQIGANHVRLLSSVFKLRSIYIITLFLPYSCLAKIALTLRIYSLFYIN